MRWTWFIERDDDCWTETFASPADAVQAMAKQQGMDAKDVPARMAEIGIFLASVRVEITPVMVLRPHGVPEALAPSMEAVAEDRRAVLQLLYEAHHREPCGPTLEAISAAIQHLQAVDGDGVTPCQPRRRISDPGAADDMRAFMAEVASSPEKARAFLQDAGILDERGELSEPYRAPGVDLPVGGKTE